MILDNIFIKTKQELEHTKQNVSFEVLEKKAKNLMQFNLRANEKKLSFKNALICKNDKIKIIAEIKKASPSKGVIRQNFDYMQIAKKYEANGASCMSILTEPFFFQGSLRYLEKIANNFKIPLLRKDFIFDKYQILQAYISGASAVLLIVKMLDLSLLKELIKYAKFLKLDVLLEIHNKKEAQIAIMCEADIIGINHRNLDDFSINLELCDELVPFIRKNSKTDTIIVAESGIEDTNIIKRLLDIGVDAFLIGEFFMKQKNVGDKLKYFVNIK